MGMCLKEFGEGPLALSIEVRRQSFIIHFEDPSPHPDRLPDPHPELYLSQLDDLMAALAHAKDYVLHCKETVEEQDKKQERQAAVCYIEREDERILCVWNLRYGGWSLPGGMVEPGETVPQALARELREETGMTLTAPGHCIFQGRHELEAKDGAREGRASVVSLYRVAASGEPRECEPGCPVTWLTREQFLKWSPFSTFYAKIFADYPPHRPWPGVKR